MSERILAVVPPNIHDYLSADGKLHIAVPPNALLRKLVQHANGTYKQHLFLPRESDMQSQSNVESEVDSDTKYVLSFYDSSNNMHADFLDENSEYVPVTYTDGSLIQKDELRGGQPSVSGTNGIDQTAFLQTVDIVTRNAANTQKDLPVVRVWDGNPDGWYSWKENIMNRLQMQGIPFLSPGNIDASALTGDHEMQIYNLIHTYTKRGDTEHGRRVSLFIMRNKTTGSALVEELIDYYERDNVHYLRTLKNKLNNMKLKDFPTKGRRAGDLYDVEDFFNTLDINEVKYTEAGGVWSEEKKIEMLGDAWDGCKLHLDHYAQHRILYEELGQSVNSQSVRRSLLLQHRIILEAMSAEDVKVKRTEKVSEDKGQTLAVIGN